MVENNTLLKLRYGRLYYHGGNFYQPLTLCGDEYGKVKRAIRDFTKANSELIKSDRLDPNYRNLLELCDEQFQHSICSV